MFSRYIGHVFFAPNFQMLLPYYNNIALALVQCLTLVSFISSEIFGYQHAELGVGLLQWIGSFFWESVDNILFFDEVNIKPRSWSELFSIIYF